MGLDMYLTARVSPSFTRFTDTPAPEYNTAINVAVESARKSLHLPESQDWNVTLEIEITYWRKANAIHRWFVENVQDGTDDCNNYAVAFSQLADLVETCRAVLADNSKAEELLPPQEGFFFGGTELGEYYFETLEYTAIQLGQLVAQPEPSILAVGFYYHSSW